MRAHCHSSATRGRPLRRGADEAGQADGAGEAVGLLGPSGCGKSTLARVA
ncbi:ATP-binding cassette domain-containing protein, partial [Streptomyces sp. NPDC003011]